MLIFFTFLSLTSYAQDNLISLENMDRSMGLESFIQEVELQSNFSFVYNPDKLKGIQIKAPGGEDIQLEVLLGIVLSPLGFSFVVYRDKIIIKNIENVVPMHKLQSSSQISAIQINRMEKILIGRVLCNDDNQPIIGASVRIKKQFRGTASDHDGFYDLKCFIGDTLVVSAIGFLKYEAIVGLKLIEDIRLKTDVVNLQEVNVIGYGEEAKEEKIGAMSTITTAMSGEIPNDFDETLGGTASGVWFQKSSGVPGSSSTIAIRGVTSLQPDANSPLIVVDGVPLFSGDENLNTIRTSSFSGAGFSFFDNFVFNDIRESQEFQKNGFNMINPEDIESISVLKDAYSTSIYGSRGAAGVILITTKKPIKNGLEVNLLMEAGVSKPIGKPDLMNGEEYAGFYSSYYTQLKNEEVIFPSNYNTDWYDLVIRNAKGNKLTFSLQNKKHNGHIYLSLSQLDQEAYIIGSDFKRYTGRFNFQQKLNQQLVLGANLSMSSERNNSLLAPKIYRDAILKAPNVPVYDEAGNFIFSNFGNPYGRYTENPLAMALNDKGEISDNYMIANVFADFDLTNWLTYRLDFGINFIDTDATSSYRNSSYPDKKITIDSDGYSRKWVVTNTLSGRKTFHDHRFKFVLGQSFEQSRQKEEELLYESSYAVTNRNSYDLLDFETIRRKYALASWFGRLNYNYKQKFFGGISYRLDGSSRFSNANRYQIFPAFSAGWIIESNDDNRFLNLVKLRASFGYSGVEQSTYTYGALRTYETQQYDLTYGGKTILVESNGSNLGLSWERTKNFDFGFDFSFLKKRLSGSIDYYAKKVNNLLLFADVAAVSGYTKQWINVGAMKNTGVELTLESRIIDRKVKWDVALTAAYNKNEVIELNYVGNETWEQDRAYKYFEEGKEAAQFYLYEWSGVNSATGNPVWNKNRMLSETPPNDSESRKAFGSGMPKYNGGFNNNFKYRGFELNAFFVFAEGKKLMNGTAAILHTYTTTETNNLSPDVLNYWKNPGDITNEPALSNNSVTSQYNYTTSRTSSRFYEDASFLRLKKLVLAYYFPEKIVNSLKLERIKLYVQATNLFTLTKYSGVDPEVSAFGASSLLSGYDEVTMPQTKSVSLGLRISL
ncbi:MAG: SusC/RagA family TonB-linked outer membrane protein [Labilibaculum sp.]|nr:SusC/RagA family TonB-linked outer membrane protein [Labilibaculum sp.]